MLEGHPPKPQTESYTMKRNWQPPRLWWTTHFWDSEFNFAFETMPGGCGLFVQRKLAEIPMPPQRTGRAQVLSKFAGPSLAFQNFSRHFQSLSIDCLGVCNIMQQWMVRERPSIFRRTTLFCSAVCFRGQFGGPESSPILGGPEKSLQWMTQWSASPLANGLPFHSHTWLAGQSRHLLLVVMG